MAHIGLPLTGLVVPVVKGFVAESPAAKGLLRNLWLAAQTSMPVLLKSGAVSPAALGRAAPLFFARDAVRG